MKPSTNEDLDQLPHVIITSNDIWDPAILDCSIDVKNDVYHSTMNPTINEDKNLSLLMNAQTYLENTSIMTAMDLTTSVMFTTMHN